MLIVASLLGALSATPADSFMTPGVSHELARYRAAHIRDVAYQLHLDVTRRDSVVGSVTISFRRVSGGDVILDFRGYELKDVTVNAATLDRPSFNGAHLMIPASLARDGRNS